MMAIALAEKDVAPYLASVSENLGVRVSVGCVNSPTNITVTGDTQGIEALRVILEDKVFARKLQVGVAYHSHHMQSVQLEYRQSLGELERGILKDVRPQMFSSVTGEVISPERALTPDYWVQNLLSKVRFAEALSQMVSFLYSERKNDRINRRGSHILVEIGPTNALQRPVKDCIQDASGAKDFSYDFVLSRNASPISSAVSLAGRLRCQSYPVDLTCVNLAGDDSYDAKVLTDLPPYPFNQTTRCWLESRLSSNVRFREHAAHELLGTREPDWNPLLPRWRNVIRLNENPWILDHQVRNESKDCQLLTTSRSMVMLFSPDLECW